ncbi:MAG: hypothetical protein GXO26_05160 [Crenarchaeota archaeon]|nr:hypothetical protein [Thermoproteota archaeon]
MVAIVLERVDGREVRLDNVDSVETVRRWFRKLTVEDLLMLQRFRIIIEEGEGEEARSLAEEAKSTIVEEFRQFMLDLLTKRVQVQVEEVHRVRILDIVQELSQTIKLVDKKLETGQEQVQEQVEKGEQDSEIEILKRRVEELENDPTPLREYIKKKLLEKRCIYLAELQEQFLGRRLKYWDSPQTKFLALRFNRLVKNILRELEKELGGKIITRTVPRYRGTSGKFLQFIYIPPQKQRNIATLHAE